MVSMTEELNLIAMCVAIELTAVNSHKTELEGGFSAMRAVK